MKELFVGEERRSSPAGIVLGDWLRSEIPTGLVPTDVEFPATFDRSVWPSEEDLMTGPIAGQSDRNILELSPLRPCTSSVGEESSDWRLGVSLLSFRGSLTRSVREACQRNAIEHAAERPAGWTLIGCDVLDSGLAISGLLNCGQAGQDVAWRLLRRHGLMLTKHYLWPTVEIAEEFASQMTQLIPDHAPFEAVGLYLCRG